jgi:methylase of polypeptide subunit release factors
LQARRGGRSDARLLFRPDAAEVRRETFDGLEIASDLAARGDEPDFVIGVGPASKLLARLTIRRPVESVLDLGTGSGVQALLAARHAKHVVAVDISDRALAFAELNARLNSVHSVEFRRGSWLEAVAAERFDLIVANLPYVVSPDRTFVYRDSGEPGDALIRRVLGELPAFLVEGGIAQVLCSWVIGTDGDWRSRLEESFRGRDCDAIILRYHLVDAATYAAEWNRFLLGTDPRAYRETVERWVMHYRETGVDQVAFGLVALRRRSAERNWVRALVVPAAPTDGAGEHLLRLFTGWDWVRRGDVGPLQLAPGARLVRRLSLEDGDERISLEVRPNLGFAARVDEAVAHALSRSEPLAVREKKRLVGLGLLTPA